MKAIQFSVSLLLGVAVLSACAPATRPVQATEAVQPAAQPAQAAATPTTPTVTTTQPGGYTLLSPLSSAPIRQFSRAEQVINPAKQYRAVMHTSKGDITLDLDAQNAPVAVNNFVFLALNHFYDGTRFHRVIAGFMAQGGDPNSADLTKKETWGFGGPGYSFMAENKNGLKFDRPGVLGMARSASLDSQGSQFYITLAAADFLSGQYTVFGQVVGGMDVLNNLTKTASGGDQPIADAQADLLNSVDILVK